MINKETAWKVINDHYNYLVKILSQGESGPIQEMNLILEYIRKLEIENQRVHGTCETCTHKVITQPKYWYCDKINHIFRSNESVNCSEWKAKELRDE